MPALQIVEAHEQLHHGGLAGAGGAHNGHLLAGLHRGGEVPDDQALAVLVAELHVVEHNVALDVQIRGAQLGLLPGFLLLVQELENPLGGGHSHLQLVGDVGHLGDGLPPMVMEPPAAIEAPTMQMTT